MPPTSRSNGRATGRRRMASPTLAEYVAGLLAAVLGVIGLALSVWAAWGAP